jgi:hypothetical protein
MIEANYFLRLKNVHSYSIMSTSNSFYVYHRIFSSFLRCIWVILVHRINMDNLILFN